MSKIAVISAILESPATTQKEFNKIISENKILIRGRMGLPFYEHDIAVVSLTVIGDMDKINSLTGKLGRISGITVKTAISTKEIKIG